MKSDIAVDNRGLWGTHMGQHWGTHVYMQLCKGGRVDVSQVDMHTCTDTFTYSYQGVRPEEG